MRAIARTVADSILASLGVVKETTYNSGCYELAPKRDDAPLLILEGFEQSQKAAILRCVAQGLGLLRPQFWLIPKFTYFGEAPWSETQWTVLGLPALNDEVIEWSPNDLPAVDAILSAHAEHGWWVGWDLFVASTDGTLLLFLDHHDVMTVCARNSDDVALLSHHLAAAGFPCEVYP